jgi:hypothetical protein
MEPSLIKVEDSPDLLKDTVSGAVLNTNVKALAAYKARQNYISKVDTLEQKVNSMESNLREIKELLIATLASSEKR